MTNGVSTIVMIKHATNALNHFLKMSSVDEHQTSPADYSIGVIEPHMDVSKLQSGFSFGCLFGICKHDLSYQSVHAHRA